MMARRSVEGEIFVGFLLVTAPLMIVAPVPYDPNNCSVEVPCCVSSDDTLEFFGPYSKSFCKIEYPVRTFVNWNKTVAMAMDKKAMDMADKLTALNCDREACTGYACAEMFPSCFYIDNATQGAFFFETCQGTCNDCLSTCQQDLSAQCLELPDQFQIACTSDGSALRSRWTTSITILLVVLLSQTY